MRPQGICQQLLVIGFSLILVSMRLVGAAAAVEQFPPEVEESFYQALQASSREEEKRLLQDLLARYPGYPWALNNLGVIAEDQGNLQQAEVYYQRAVASDPELPHPHVGLGDIYSNQGKGALAVEHYTAFLTLVESETKRNRYPELKSHIAYVRKQCATLQGEHSSRLKPVPETSPAGSSHMNQKHETAGKSLQPENPLVVALLDFDNVGQEAQDGALGRIVAENLVTEAVSDKVFEIVERKKLKLLLDEQEIGRPDEYNVQLLDKIKELTGADAVFTGSVFKLGKDLDINIRIIDIKTALTLAAANRSAQYTLNSVKQAVKDILVELCWQIYSDGQK